MDDYLYKARDGFTVREIFDEYLLVPQDTSGIYFEETKQPLPEFNGMVTLDEVGLFLWEQLEKPHTLNELVSAVENEFETNGRDISKDILGFLNKGFENQIIFKGTISKGEREEDENEKNL